MAIAIVECDGVRYEVGPDNADVLAGSVRLTEGKKSSSAQLTISDPYLQRATEITLPTKSNVVPFDVWFGEGVAPPKVFSGYLSGVRSTIKPPRLELIATDKSKSKRRRAKMKNHANANVEALIKSVATAAGLRVDTSKASLTDVRLSQAVQFGETDWTFLTRVLESLGHNIKVRGETVYVTEVSQTRANLPAATLTYGDNVIDASFTADERTPSNTPNVFDLAGEIASDDTDDLAAETTARATKLERVGLVVTADEFPSFTPETTQQALKNKPKPNAKKCFELASNMRDRFRK